MAHRCFAVCRLSAPRHAVLDGRCAGRKNVYSVATNSNGVPEGRLPLVAITIGHVKPRFSCRAIAPNRPKTACHVPTITDWEHGGSLRARFVGVWADPLRDSKQAAVRQKQPLGSSASDPPKLERGDFRTFDRGSHLAVCVLVSEVPPFGITSRSLLRQLLERTNKPRGACGIWARASGAAMARRNRCRSRTAPSSITTRHCGSIQAGPLALRARRLPR
jgi:hypothetical protein